MDENAAPTAGQRWGRFVFAGDWEAMVSGVRARRDEALRTSLERAITDLTVVLEADSLSALAWLIADNILDFVTNQELQHYLGHQKQY